MISKSWLLLWVASAVLLAVGMCGFGLKVSAAESDDDESTVKSGSSTLNRAFVGRLQGNREILLKEGGGNADTEAAVARGLKWLISVQRNDGAWQFDGSEKGNTVAATSMALLPLLAVGQTHLGAYDLKSKSMKKTMFTPHVESALKFLLGQLKENKSFPPEVAGGGHYAYSHAIATIAICEIYCMTGDAALKGPATRLANTIAKGQLRDGGWGYTYEGLGSSDTSILGWQIQALKTAKLAEIPFKEDTFEIAKGFLDKVGNSYNDTPRTLYGYKDNQASQSLTPVGLLCRYYINPSSRTPEMKAGATYLTQLNRLPQDDNYDMYYYYYATQVLFFRGGSEWEKWNAKMPGYLLSRQTKGMNKDGSWSADTVGLIGASTGRLGTTVMALLVLEVYYRHIL